jgi:hypothetical protein
MSNAVDAAYRLARAAGGPIEHPNVHSGAIHAPVPGRTDRLPVNVWSGAYVLPADIVSGIGEGNTLAGSKTLDAMFDRERGHFAHKIKKAHGGSTNGWKPTPAILAGGEYVIDPDIVEAIGDGSLDKGHKELDAFVLSRRKKTIKTLRKLPGPVRD